MGAVLQVDKVDHDDAADVAEPHLTLDFIGGRQIRAKQHPLAGDIAWALPADWTLTSMTVIASVGSITRPPPVGRSIIG